MQLAIFCGTEQKTQMVIFCGTIATLLNRPLDAGGARDFVAERSKALC